MTLGIFEWAYTVCRLMHWGQSIFCALLTHTTRPNVCLNDAVVVANTYKHWACCSQTRTNTERAVHKHVYKHWACCGGHKHVYKHWACCSQARIQTLSVLFTNTYTNIERAIHKHVNKHWACCSGHKHAQTLSVLFTNTYKHWACYSQTRIQTLSVLFANTYKHWACCGGHKHVYKHWACLSLNALCGVCVCVCVCVQEGVQCLEASRNGRTLFTGSNDGCVRVHGLHKGEPMALIYLCCCWLLIT